MERFKRALQDSLSVVTAAAAWWVPYYDQRENRWKLWTNPSAVPLESKRGTVYLIATHDFRVEPHRLGPTVRTVEYIYQLSGSESTKDDIVAWHWHPDTVTRAHMHIYVPTLPNGEPDDWHYPTGRVFFEQILGMLIRDFDIACQTAALETLGRLQKAVPATWRGEEPD